VHCAEEEREEREREVVILIVEENTTKVGGRLHRHSPGVVLFLGLL